MHVSNKYYDLMNINAAIQLRLILQARAMHAETNKKKFGTQHNRIHKSICCSHYSYHQLTSLVYDSMIIHLLDFLELKGSNLCKDTLSQSSGIQIKYVFVCNSNI